MATLRFTSENCVAESVLPASDKGKVSLTLALTRGGFEEIAGALAQLELAEGNELRTDFPSGWTVFWKLREGESRFFVAHPELDTWVATLALSRTHLERICEKMANGTAGSLSSLEPVSKVSNVEVTLRLMSGTTETK